MKACTVHGTSHDNSFNCRECKKLNCKGVLIHMPDNTPKDQVETGIKQFSRC